MQNTVDQIGYSRDDAWSIPDGAIWVKHFDLETTRGDPSSTRRLETRFIVRNQSGAYGVSYRWNDEESEAFLVPDAGESFTVTIDDRGAPVEQTWQIPSRSQCLSCHVPQTGHVLSFDTRQLNREGQLGQKHGNFLSLLADAGYLSGFDGEVPNALPRYVRASESEYSLEARARSYLAVNCASCHRRGGTAPAAWDARAHLPLVHTNLLESFSTGGGGGGDHLIVPAEAERSIIWNRISVSNGYTRMPPLGSNLIDTSNTKLISDWIESLSPARPIEDFTAWRTRWFGDATSPDGAPGSDHDEDGCDNFAEFLSITNPLDPVDYYRPGIEVGDGSVRVLVPRLEDRAVFVETSPDLRAWRRWDLPGNDGLPRSANTRLLEAPISELDQFFRILIQSQEPE
jgi:mono/diheme cytochrome c family protein